MIIIPKVFSATSDYSDKVFVSLTRSPLDCSLFFLPDERDKCCSFHAEVEEHAHASNGHGAEDPEDGSPAEEGHDRVVKQHADQTGHREPDEEQCVDFDAQAWSVYLTSKWWEDREVTALAGPAQAYVEAVHLSVCAEQSHREGQEDLDRQNYKVHLSESNHFLKTSPEEPRNRCRHETHRCNECQVLVVAEVCRSVTFESDLHEETVGQTGSEHHTDVPEGAIFERLLHGHARQVSVDSNAVVADHGPLDRLFD